MNNTITDQASEQPESSTDQLLTLFQERKQAEAKPQYVSTIIAGNCIFLGVKTLPLIDRFYNENALDVCTDVLSHFDSSRLVGPMGLIALLTAGIATICAKAGSTLFLSSKARAIDLKMYSIKKSDPDCWAGDVHKYARTPETWAEQNPPPKNPTPKPEG